MRDSEQNENNPFQKLAVASLIAPVVAVAVVYLMGKTSLTGHVPALIGVVVSLGLVAAGGLFGIIALFGITKHGPERILVPALLGIAFTGALVVYVVLPAFLRTRAYATAHPASSRTPPQPVVHLQGAHLLHDEHLHFSVDIPEGFKAWSDKTLTNFDYCYERDLVENGNYARVVIAIQQLNGIIPANQHLRPEDAARQAPRGVKVDLIEKNWRGIKIDGLLNEQSQNGVSILTYVVQIPLAPSAIQMIVHGPASNRAEIEKLIDDIVASIDGNTNWQ